VRRANGYILLSLLFACLGVAVGSGAVDIRQAGPVVVCTTALMAAVASALMAKRLTRRALWGSLDQNQRTVTRLQLQVQELEAKLLELSLDCRSASCVTEDVSARMEPVVEAAAAATSTAGTELVHHLSHELRTPLTSIHACSELLLEGDPADGATRRDLVTIIHQESQRLALFIDSALTRTRLESGLPPVRREPIVLHGLLARTISSLLPLAGQRGVAIDLQPSSPDAVVLGDRDLLEHALRFHLCEAIGQTPTTGTIEVRTSHVSDRNVVRLEASCRSSQVDQKLVSPRFDRFYGGADRCLAGDAAGAALARQVIEEVHGGKCLSHQPDDPMLIGFELPSGLPVQATESQDEVTHV